MFCSPEPNRKYYADYLKFATAQVTSWDIDPVYPVVKTLLTGDDLETQAWKLFVFLGYYHLGSAYTMWQRYPHADEGILTDPLTTSLATGTERRGFRGNRLILRYFRSVLTRKGSLYAWLASQGNWSKLRVALETLEFCGPWASFKMADLCSWVLGLDITAPDIGQGSGSVAGWRDLWGDLTPNPHNCALVLERCRKDGAGFETIDQMETTLCDFHSLVSGRYYVGHDIDQMLEQLLRMKQPVQPFFEARAAVIPAKYLGEQSGWGGVRKHLNTLYKNSKVLYL